jgi:hypothetical protein
MIASEHLDFGEAKKSASRALKEMDEKPFYQDLSRR